LFDLGILNGKIYLEGSFISGNIYVKDGKIAAISGTKLEASQEYDAGGKMVLPGFIDPHVHFALTVGSMTSVDDFYSGSVAAAYGGVTTYIDFVDPVSKTSELEGKFNERRNLAKNSVIDYGLHCTIAELYDDPAEFSRKTVELGMPTVKLFTTYATTKRRTYDRTICSLLKISKQEGILLLVHAENDSIVLEGKQIPVSQHGNARPEISEISEVIKLAQMTEYENGRMYIVHTNCGTTIERLVNSYSDILNKDFIIESCPHYFTLSSELYISDMGYLYTMTPPLRSMEEVNKLNKYIDYIYTIGTDHCPFNSGDKKKNYVNEIPMGIGGIEQSFPVMYSIFGEKVIDKFTINPARAHGLYPRKGSLKPGSDADIVIFDPNNEYRINEQHSLCDYNVYENFIAKGKVCSTISRGRFVVKDGSFLGGEGEYIPRRL
jgi:dihydropyrimidinase